MKTRIISFTILIFFTLFSPLLAAMYYVDAADGSDLNRGTAQNTPFRTIQKAANTIIAGDTVIVLAGTYNERITETTSGSPGKPITYEAAGNVYCRGFTLSNGCDYVTIKGFDINPTQDDNVDGQGVFIGSGSQYIIVDGCTIHDAPRSGVKLYPDSSNCTVRNCTISYVWLCGIDVYGSSHTIEKNDISHILQYPPEYASPPSWTDADGMHFMGENHVLRGNKIHNILRSDGNSTAHIDNFQIIGPVTDCVIEGNYFNIYREGMGEQGAMISDYKGAVKNLTIKNNIFVGACTIVLEKVSSYGLNNIRIINNTFYGGSYYSVQLKGCTYATVQNNIFYDCGAGTRGYVYVQSASVPTSTIGNNNIYSSTGSPSTWAGGSFTIPAKGDQWDIDPKIANVGSEDFTLLPDSPCINAGISFSDVADDFYGNQRPIGSGHDIGACEYTKNSAADTIPPTSPSGVRASMIN